MSDRSHTGRGGLDDPNAEVRRQAVLGLARQPAEERADGLIRALADEDWRVRKEAVPLAASMASERPDFIPRLIAASGDAENIGLRNAAVSSLKDAGPAAIGAVLACLDSADPQVRQTALEIVGLSRDKRARRTLVNALEDEDANVRAFAAEQLGSYADETAAEALRSCLARDDHMLRLFALQALANMNAPIPWAVLSPLLGEPLLQEPLVVALGLSGAPEAVPEVLSRLPDHEAAGWTALVSLHDAAEETARAVEAGLARLDEDGTARLQQGVRAEDEAVKSAATRCLLWTRRPEQMETIVHLARNSLLYPLLVDELGAWGETAVRPLETLLHRTEGRTLASTIGLLTRLLDDADGQRLAEAFADCLASDHPAVATAAAAAVSRFGNEAIIPRLLELTDADDRRIRSTAGKALCDLARRYPEAVHRTVRDMEIRGRRGIELCRILAVVGGREECAHLAEALSSPEPDLRRAALFALSVLCDSESVDRVAACLKDPDLAVRLQAVDALAGLGPAAAQAVVDALDGASGPLAAALVRALGKTGHPDAESILAMRCRGASDVALAAVEAAKELGIDFPLIGDGALWHEDPEVIKQALRSYRGSVSMDELLRLATHAEWDVRLAAVRGLEGRRCEPSVRQVLQGRLDDEENDLVRDALLRVLSAMERGIDS